MTPVAIPQVRAAAVVSWATNPLYPSRVHMTNGRGRVSLCGFPINAVTRHRPATLRICPDCATAYVDVSFPAGNAGRAGDGPVEWFRQLPLAVERAAPDTITPREI